MWLKMFYFILKVLFVLKVFNFLSWQFGLVEKKRLGYKDQVNFKICDIITWLTLIWVHMHM